MVHFLCACSFFSPCYSCLPTYLLFLKLARTSHTHTSLLGWPTHTLPPFLTREESGSVHETSKSSSHTHTAITICSVQDIELQSCVGPGQDVKLQPQPVLGRTLNCSRNVSPGEDA